MAGGRTAERPAAAVTSSWTPPSPDRWERRNVAVRWRGHQSGGAGAVCRAQAARGADRRARRHRRRCQARAERLRRRQRRRHRRARRSRVSPRCGRCARSSARWGSSDSARYEIDFRLGNKERDYEDAVLAAHGLTFDAVADDGLVIAGQPVRLSIVAVNRGASDVSVTGVAIAGFDTPGPCAAGAGEEGRRLHLRRGGAHPQGREADHAVLPRRLLEAPGEPGHPHLRSGRAVRRSVRAHAVPRHLPCEGRRASRSPRNVPVRIPLREGHLLRRQADGAECGARLLGEGDAGAGGDSGGRREPPRSRSSARSTSR